MHTHSRHIICRASASKAATSPTSTAMAAPKRRLYTPSPSAADPNGKRHRTAYAMDAAAAVPFVPEPEEQQPLLPGLPDHLAQLCLSSLPPKLLHAVCRPWRRLLYSPSFPPFPSLYAVLDEGGSVSFAAYDTMSGIWEELPPPPLPSPPPKLWHPSFLSRRLPLQTVAASGRLVLVAGSTQALGPALAHGPVVFDPATTRWRLGPSFPFAPRRWCAAGAAQGRVFVAGGVGAGYDPADARAGATWDPSSDSSASGWAPLPPLRDGRFSRDAAEAVCSRGKVCMVSLRCRGAKEGVVFDLGARRWEDMPPGMLAGWTGPSAACECDGGETIFVVDDHRGALLAYHWDTDRWRTVLELDRLKGAAEITAGGGRVCVVVDGGNRVVVVDVTSSSAKRLWEVAAPAGKRVVALHVLPRMTRATG